MDLNRIFAMLGRIFFRSAVNTGIDYMARKGKPEEEMTPEERAQARNAREMASKAQKAARLGRRFLK